MSAAKTWPPEREGSGGSLRLEKIWDLPTRLFHWLLAASVIAGWYFGEFRTFSTIDWHFYLGQATGWLLVFRLFWGFYGPAPARFSTIIPSRGALFGYLRHLWRRTPSGIAGHNPVGGLSVAALLIVLSVQVICGFFSEDDGLFASGPFVKFASPNWVLFAGGIHHKSSLVLLMLVVLHVAAIAFYHLWKRENLILPMISGWKRVRSRNLEHDAKPD